MQALAPARMVMALALWVALAGCFERGGNQERNQESGQARAPTHEQPATQPGVPPQTAPGREPTAAPDADATITVHLEAEPAHLSPLLAGDAMANRLALGDIYQGLLCQQGPDTAPEPCLAASVEHTDDGKVWRFRLRQGVTWHDGAPFGADDVLFTYGLITGKNPRVPTWLAADFDDLQSIEVVHEPSPKTTNKTTNKTKDNTNSPANSPAGHDTIVMTFAGFRLGRDQAFARVPIVPRHVFGRVDGSLMSAPAHRQPVGTGPLSLVSWTPGQSIVVERAPSYWGSRSGARRIVYQLMEHRSRALRALAAGALDVAVQVPVDEARQAAAESRDVTVFAYDMPAYLAAVYNLRSPLLADARARRGLGMLMDRPALASSVFGGHARPISGPYLRDDPDRDPALAPLPFDPEAGRALLAQARASASAKSSDSAAAELTVLVPAGSRTMARIADIWARDARAAVRLNITPVAYADVLTRLRQGDFDIALMAFTTGLDLDLYSRFHSNASENYGKLADPELDAALEAVRTEPDPEKRRQLQRQVQHRLHELQPYTFIVSDTRVGLVRADIGGFAHAASGARGLWRARRGP